MSLFFKVSFGFSNKCFHFRLFVEFFSIVSLRLGQCLIDKCITLFCLIAPFIVVMKTTECILARPSFWHFVYVMASAMLIHLCVPTLSQLTIYWLFLGCLNSKDICSYLLLWKNPFKTKSRLYRHCEHFKI